MPALETPRLRLVPVTLELVEAVLARDRARTEDVLQATLPPHWPDDDLIARAFPYSLAAIRAAPDIRLWGDSIVLPREGPRHVVGSVVFHGFPDDGIAEVAYGVADLARNQGLASEATAASVEWALAQPGIDAVRAVTFPWHAASLGVIRHLGMTEVGVRDHDLLGELRVFERRRP
jgi:RimJ/RimL family protein N-acetyltransferase